MLTLARALRPRAAAAAAAARPAASAWARPFSTGEEPSTPAVSSEEALAFARERKQHRAVLGYLRRAWATEQEAKRHAAQDQASAERDAIRAARKKERTSALKEKRERRAATEAARADARRGRLERKQASRERQELREDVLSFVRAKRRDNLLRAAEGWIPEADLDARIREALENPCQLPGGGVFLSKS